MTPRTRLKAVLSAYGVLYPTFEATVPTVASGSQRRSAASVRRHSVRNVIGGSPTTSWNRRASAARDTPVSAARAESVQYRLAAGVLHLVGVGLLTGLYHVPRNNLLDGLDPSSPEGIAYWATYLEEWVRMNHVRTLAPLVAAFLLTVSLRVG